MVSLTCWPCRLGCFSESCWMCLSPSLLFCLLQIPENPPDYQKYYRHMNKVQCLELVSKGRVNRAGIWAKGMGMRISTSCPYKNRTGQGKVLSPSDPFPGWLPLQHPRLWLDRGRLHSRGAEVSHAAAGEVPLHSQACPPRAPL